MDNPTQQTFFNACAQGDVAAVCQLQNHFTARTLCKGAVTAAINVQADVVRILMRFMCSTVFDAIATHAKIEGGDGWLPDLVQALGDEADCRFCFQKSRMTTLRKFAEELCDMTDEPTHPTIMTAEPWRH